jgi:hypothetical protein
MVFGSYYPCKYIYRYHQFACFICNLFSAIDDAIFLRYLLMPYTHIGTIPGQVKLVLLWHCQYENIVYDTTCICHCINQSICWSVYVYHKPYVRYLSLHVYQIIYLIAFISSKPRWTSTLVISIIFQLFYVDQTMLLLLF